MITLGCEQAEILIRIDPDRLRARSCHGTIRHDIDLDDLTPFYAQDRQVVWLGEQALDVISIEDSEDMEPRCAPGYSNPGGSIDLQFLANAVALERAGDLRSSLALIYRRIDEMMRLGMIALIDEELCSVGEAEIGSDVLLGLLTATLPVKSQLPSRPTLFKKTKRVLKSRGHYEPGILDGLK